MFKAFYDGYEASDPEPELRWEDGAIGRHYFWPDVLAHIAWHRRMSDFYIKNVAGRHHYDEVTCRP